MRVGSPLRNRMVMSLTVGFAMVYSGCGSSSQGQDVAALSIALKGDAAGGTISSQPDGITCGTTCSNNFNLGSAVTLFAVPTEGYDFKGWEGACTGTASICSLTLDSAKEVSATFLNTHLTVTLGGSGTGKVTSMPAGLACPGTCSAGFARNAQVTLTAVPDEKLVFAGWGGACSGSTPTCTLSLPIDTQVTANFRYPQSCEEIRTSYPSPADGNYTLYIAGDKTKPWTAFCIFSPIPAQSYLNLTNTGANQNFAQFTTGGNGVGTSVRTSYTKLRIDPVTLKVDTNDQNYTTTTGGPITLGSNQITSMPYATAADCVKSGSNTGLANIDLTGTQFAVAMGGLTLAGSNAVGATTPAPDGQVRVINLTGGGNCGWYAALGSFNPYNKSGSALNLVYLP